jgi:thiol-disulfide isomerase/thioredoxin
MPGVLDTNTQVEGRGRVLRSHSFSGRETNSVFFNREGRAFRDLSGISGMDSIADGRGFAYLDYNRDGWVDVALVNSNAPQLELFRNRMGELGGSGRAIHVRLVGGNHEPGAAPGRCPRDGVGAHVRVKAGALALLREARLGDGFAAQNSATLTIGIGGNEEAEVRVVWPSGRVTDVGRVAAGLLATVREFPEAGSPAVTTDVFVRPARTETGGPMVAVDHWPSSLPQPESPARLRLITTMATWCPVCRSELPHLERLRAALSPEDAGLFAFPIDPEDTPDKLAGYQRDAAPAYTFVPDSTPGQREELKQLLVKHLGEAALPSSIVIDRRGAIVRIRKGLPSVSEVRRLLRQIE